MTNRRRSVLPALLSTAVGLSGAVLMFALPGDAAPLPTTYGAEASADVWHLSMLDLDMSGDSNPAVDLSAFRVRGVTTSETNPRSLARADNASGTTADGDDARRGAISRATSGADTTSATAGTAPAAVVADVLELEQSTLSSRGRWVGDSACLPATERLTDSSAITQGASLVAAAVPAEDENITIPVVDVEIPPPGGGTLPPLPDPTASPTPIPGLPTPTGSPAPTDDPTLPTDFPSATEVTTIPTELPTSILPTLTETPTLPPLLPRLAASAAEAGEPVSMMSVAPSRVDQRTWLAQRKATPDVRGVRAEAIGTPLNLDQPVAEFFDGEIAVRMASQPRLTAYADGANPGVVTWQPPAMTLLVAGQANPATIPADGTPVRVNYSGNRQVVVEVSAGQLTDVVRKDNGLAAEAKAAALHVVITRETETGGSIVLEADLFPMTVEVSSPAGGVECRVADSDGDGLTDAREKRLGTNKNRKDTDRDRLTDGQEVLKHRTNPLKKDTDRDGLSDGREVTKHKTNPRRKDTDRDGVSDGHEVKRGTDPLK